EAFKQFVLEHGQGLIAQRFGQFVQGQAEAAGDEPAATPS
ncbi:MAG: hypothetical protein RL500_504, partial [Pseudomonadota bacterium]